MYKCILYGDLSTKHHIHVCSFRLPTRKETLLNHEIETTNPVQGSPLGRMRNTCMTPFLRLLAYFSFLSCLTLVSHLAEFLCYCTVSIDTFALSHGHWNRYSLLVLDPARNGVYLLARFGNGTSLSPRAAGSVYG